MINAAYSSACSLSLDSLLAEALNIMISFTSASVIWPSAFLSTMSKKIWRRESKLLSVICCQISRSSSWLILSTCIRRRRLSVSNSSIANSCDSVMPMHFGKSARER
uniref:RbohC n=1 Tax=Arundo donax TaxID=35708 RepID=A0A0A8XVB8_ARUDO